MNINNCYTGTAIEQLEEGCAGNYTSTDCTQTPNAISYLDLPAGSSQTEINAALTASLLFKDQQIAEFSSTVIEAGDNIEITGVGSEENPYIVSSTGGAQDLQSVLDNGGYAEVGGGNSSIDLLTGDENDREFKIVTSNGTDNYYSRLRINGSGSQIITRSGEDIGSGISTGEDSVQMEAYNENGYNQLRIQAPLSISDIIVYTPSKINAGIYHIPAYPDITYLVSALPTGQLNDIAVVTDANTPTYLGALSGGGTTVTPVWHNGTIWVAR